MPVAAAWQEEAPQRGLGAWVQVAFGLLDEEHLRLSGSQELGRDRKDLADAVAHVDQVAHRTLVALAGPSDLDLEGSGIAPASAEVPDSNLVEEAGFPPEPLQSRPNVPPVLWVAAGHVRKEHGHVVALRVQDCGGWVVGAARLRPDGGACEGSRQVQPIDLEVQMAQVPQFPGHGLWTPRRRTRGEHPDFQERAKEAPRTGTVRLIDGT